MLVGVSLLRTMPVGCVSDLNRPTVTIMTEAPGLAPEEVEVLVTRPIELLLKRSDRSQTRSIVVGHGSLRSFGLEFDWGTDIFIDRQIVNREVATGSIKTASGYNPDARTYFIHHG